MVIIKKFKETWHKFQNWRRNWRQNLIGWAILLEAFSFFAINCVIIYYFDIIKRIEDIILLFKISSITATDAIAILTSLLLTMGFIYFVGFGTAAKRKNPNISGHGFRDAMLYNGGILFLAFFLSLLIIFLYKYDYLDIIGYIAINILLVFIFGFGNEWYRP